MYAFERAGTDRVKAAHEAATQAFGTALAGPHLLRNHARVHAYRSYKWRAWRLTSSSSRRGGSFGLVDTLN
jgi:hypothetical protein